MLNGKEHEITDEPLKVFCVSASKFFDLEETSQDNLSDEGFMDQDETGITQLREFCIAAILPAHEQELNSFLTKLDVLRGKLSSWAWSDAIVEKFSVEKRNHAKEVAIKQFDFLRKVSSYYWLYSLLQKQFLLFMLTASNSRY